MGLYLFPSPYPCRGRKSTMFTSREKGARGETGECWFQHGDHPGKPAEAACWFNGELLVRELEAIGKKRLAKKCFSNLSARGAGRFGKQLLCLAKELRQHYWGLPPSKQPAISERVSFFSKKNKSWIRQPYTTSPGHVVEILEKSGNWYRKASALGSGVVAWY